MSDDRIVDETTSILEYSADVGHQEAPNPLPVRDYRMTCKAAAVKPSSKGGMNVKFDYHVDPNDYPADYADGNPDGETLSVYMSTEDTVKARFRMRKHCEAHGVVASKQIDLNEFIGKEVKGTIKHEPFEGVMQARISKLSPIN